MAKNLGVHPKIYEKRKTGFNINVDYCVDQLRNHQKKIFNTAKIQNARKNLLLKNFIKLNFLK